MNRLLAMTVLLISLLVAAAFAPFPAGLHAQQGGGWTTLLDGKSLDGWNKVGDANWRVVKSADGDYIEADKGSGFLVTPQAYSNYTLKVEFWADTPANSGIFIRITDPQKIAADSSYEVNIFDQRPDPRYRTGGIVNVAEPKAKVDAAGKWHTYEITARGDRLTAKWDGVLSAEGTDAKFASGPIALQYSAGTVRFRNVQIQLF